MAFSEAEKQRILAAFNERAPQLGICALCRKGSWTLAGGFTLLPIQDTPQGLVIGGPVMPCVAITCTNCGNTHLLNLIVLGLRDMLEQKPGA